LLGDRQCIHVGPQHDHRARLRATQQRDHSGVRNACLYFKTQPSEVCLGFLGGLELAVA